FESTLLGAVRTQRRRSACSEFLDPSEDDAPRLHSVCCEQGGKSLDLHRGGIFGHVVVEDGAKFENLGLTSVGRNRNPEQFIVLHLGGVETGHADLKPTNVLAHREVEIEQIASRIMGL